VEISLSVEVIVAETKGLDGNSPYVIVYRRRIERKGVPFFFSPYVFFQNVGPNRANIDIVHIHHDKKGIFLNAEFAHLFQALVPRVCDAVGSKPGQRLGSIHQNGQSRVFLSVSNQFLHGLVRGGIVEDDNTIIVEKTAYFFYICENRVQKGGTIANRTTNTAFFGGKSHKMF